MPNKEQNNITFVDRLSLTLNPSFIIALQKYKSKGEPISTACCRNNPWLPDESIFAEGSQDPPFPSFACLVYSKRATNHF